MTKPIMDSNMQPDYFNGCVLISSLDSILTIDSRVLSKKEFDKEFGGHIFETYTGSSFDRYTESAYESATMSHYWAIASVESACFRPDLPSNTLVGGETGEGALKNHYSGSINTYVPSMGDVKRGDPIRFLHYIDRMLPDKDEYHMLIDYLAWCIQNPDKKLKWAMVLQGECSNRDRILYDVMSHALGDKYVYRAFTSDTQSTFDEWVLNKLFICADGAISNDLERHIKNKNVAIETRTHNQRMTDICPNFLILAKTKEIIPTISGSDYHHLLVTAQQNRQEADSDGLDYDYFASLCYWLFNEDGLEIVSYYLMNHDISSNFSQFHKPNLYKMAG